MVDESLLSELHKGSLLSIDESERELPVKKSTIRSWIQQNRLPVIRLGRRVFIKRETIERLLKEGLDAVEPDKQTAKG